MSIPRSDAPSNTRRITKFVRPKRDPDKVAFAKSVYNLLWRPSHGRPQRGDAYGTSLRITCNDFEDHLYGGVTLAVACALNGKANFLSWDCDEDFPRRLAIYAKVLAARGLEKAAFVTTGSTAERGKVVLALAERIPHARAVALAKEIQGEVKADPDFGEVHASKLTPFPSNGASFCRVLGRKYPDPAPFERLLDLQGRPADTLGVVPARITAPVPITSVAITPGGAQNLSAWAQIVIEEPFTGSEPQLLATQLRLADEAIRVFGEQAESRFLEWMETIARNSPSASSSVQRQLFRADAYPKARAYILRHGRPTLWAPFRRPYTPGVHIRSSGTKKSGINKVSSGWRAYESIATYALVNHVDPHAIALDYQRIADLCGYVGKEGARRAVLCAEDCGFLKRLHPGAARTKDRPGTCALYCLRGEGESLADAIAKGERSSAYRLRVGGQHAGSQDDDESTAFSALREAVKVWIDLVAKEILEAASKLLANK
jgi:hypothetical protein